MPVSETYLKTRQVAQALGVSPSTIQRWVDAGSIDATRTIGNHRRVLLSSVLEFARRERMPVGNLLALGDSPEPATPTVPANPAPTPAAAGPTGEFDAGRVEILADLLRQGRS